MGNSPEEGGTSRTWKGEVNLNKVNEIVKEKLH
jgi:hypothetical protein